MKNKILYILVALFIIVGLAVLFYPTFSSLYNAQIHKESIMGYDDSVNKLDQKTIDDDLEAARAYNESLTGQGITDPFIPGGGLKLPPGYSSILDVNNGMMGYIDIPKIDADLPLYHGTSAPVLEKGIGHMEMTAFPIGGIGNHAVLTGHSALPNSVLFTDLDKLEEGDQFYIRIYHETIAYEVNHIMVVEPDDTTSLIPDANKDLMTLVTCTPYAINSHRLLVQGERIPYSELAEQQQVVEANGWEGLMSHYDLVIALGILLIVIIAIAATISRRKRIGKREEASAKPPLE